MGRASGLGVPEGWRESVGGFAFDAWNVDYTEPVSELLLFEIA